jgi:hypothetical protein
MFILGEIAWHEWNSENNDQAENILAKIIPSNGYASGEALWIQKNLHSFIQYVHIVSEGTFLPVEIAIILI